MKMTKKMGNYRLLGVTGRKGSRRVVDYYLIAGNEKFYAFSKVYTNHSYQMCKSGIRLSDLLTKKSRDNGVMSLVNSTSRIIPYLMEAYEIPA